MFGGIFKRRRDPEVAQLRDRLISAETRVLLLEDVVNHRQRVLREPRSDKHSVRDAYEAFHARLRAECAEGQRNRMRAGGEV